MPRGALWEEVCMVAHCAAPAGGVLVAAGWTASTLHHHRVRTVCGRAQQGIADSLPTLAAEQKP